MRTAPLLMAAGLMGLGVLMAQNGPAPWFSAAQAQRGQALALQQCAACHGVRLEGRYGPPLSGSRFSEKWRGQGGKALQLYIAQNMPKGQAGHLSQTQTLELIAFILQTNGYPGGRQDLTPETLEQLKLFQP